MSEKEREQAVRELAEEIVRTANGSCYPFEGENREALVASVEPLLQAFLAEREGGREERALWKLGKARSRSAELASEVAALRGALEEAFAVGGDVGLRPIDALLRSLDIMKAALAPGAGEREAEVLRAAVLMADATEYWLDYDNHAQVHQCIPCESVGVRLEDLVHDEECPIKVFVAYRDALLAARGGEST